MGRQRSQGGPVTEPNKAKTGTVYVLIDPRNNRVRYVGATTKTLKARLQGHMTRAATRVKAWIDDLAADGLSPRIEPIDEGIPESQLRDREREEITRRLIAGDRLLNEAATAQGRRHLEQRCEEERIEHERLAWEHVANQVRSIVGGPLAPGDVAPIPINPKVMADYRALLRAREEAARIPAATEFERAEQAARLERAHEKISEALWRSVQPSWGELRGIADRSFDYLLEGRVYAAFKKPWADLQDLPRYLALIPWGIMAVGPWAALAERAGMDITSTEFIDWVSDDADVRDALHVLLVRAGGRMGPLSALDNFNNLSRPSTGLVAMTAAHSEGFELPRVLNGQVVAFLDSIVRDGQLTPAMGDLLQRLDRGALDRLLGPNIAAGVDAQLSLQPGTSVDVLTAVLEKSTALHVDSLRRIVNRAKGKFPTVETPDFRLFVGNTVPMLRAITASLVVSGAIPAPADRKPAEVVNDVRALWCGDRSEIGWAA